MNKHASQPRAIYYVVALQIWEYFSFYGMRALLILYLTNQLKYNDTHAYELFSAYCSLVYVTPILGGFLADKVLGNRMAVMGFAELFIDPVAMSQITRIEIPGVTGVLTGIYMLLSGAIANYLAGVIADQTSQASFDASGAINYSINAYIEVFDQITWGALACVGVVLMIWLYQALKFRNRALALES
ncbi:hypothetical protein E2615_RS18580 [Escherichia coli]|nr:hypothetical protein [Escherichia coli]MBL5250506.1 hypothetical protein [Escherichia coli O157:H7]EEZ0210057.1 hypothetical protein [Escherichia coli]EEZ0643831.1 hypothetical protein [Escherichia coli]EEZ4331179.1 hypothetical protein [Escherichia coli]